MNVSSQQQWYVQIEWRYGAEMMWFLRKVRTRAAANERVDGIVSNNSSSRPILIINTTLAWLTQLTSDGASALIVPSQWSYAEPPVSQLHLHWDER